MNRTNGRIAALLALLTLAGCGQTSSAPAPPSATPAPAAQHPAASPRPTPSTTPRPTAVPTPTPTAGPPAVFTTLPNGVSYVDLDAEATFMSVGDDAVWLVAYRSTSRDILRIDPVTLEIDTVVRGQPMLGDPSHGMEVNGTIWLSEYGLGRVRRYDAVTGQDLGALEVGLNPYFSTYAFDDIWVPLHHDGAIARVDTSTATVEATIEFAAKGGAGPLVVDAGGGLMWSAAPNTPRVVGIDPATNRIVRDFPLDEECQPGVSWFRGRLFVGGCSPEALILDAETGRELGRNAVGLPAGHERLDAGDRIWVVAPSATEADYAIAAVDATTLKIVDTFRTGVAIRDWYYAGAFDGYWVSSGLEGRIIHIPRSALPTGEG